MKMKIKIAPAKTGYTDRHYEVVAGEVPEGFGANGGPRERLAILARSAPAWQQAVWDALPEEARPEARVVALVGRARIAVVLEGTASEIISGAKARVQAAQEQRAAMLSEKESKIAVSGKLASAKLAEKHAAEIGGIVEEVEPSTAYGMDAKATILLDKDGDTEVLEVVYPWGKLLQSAYIGHGIILPSSRGADIARLAIARPGAQ